MGFALQFTVFAAKVLRDIEACLRSMGGKLYQHGISGQGGTLDSGGSQRIARLEDLRGISPKS